MHELSIAQEIIEIIHQYVPEDKRSTVNSVKIKVGKLSNILVDSLTFCFEAVVSSSELKNAKLVINEMPITVKCLSCNQSSNIEVPIFCCPLCNNADIEIISGNELSIEEIELNEN